MKLSGFVVTKNCIKLDYCIKECIESMLPLCDEVVVGDMGSDDGTIDLAASLSPKVIVFKIRDWTQERANHKWYVNALNETRNNLSAPMALALDADEVLGDDHATLSVIKTAVEKHDAIAIDRLNFAKDPYGLIPEGECCGKFVTRVGPSHLEWVSDEFHERGEIPLLDMAHIEPTAKIFHLGFLRKRPAFYAKARVVLGAFFDNYDSRLTEAEGIGADPLSKFEWFNRLDRYDGYYPDSVKAWLIERGHNV